MGEIAFSVLLIFYVFASMWTEVEDCEDHLLVTYGPLRWLLCGMGKEKVRYKNVVSFEVTKTCSYGAACRCDYHNVKLFKYAASPIDTSTSILLRFLDVQHLLLLLYGREIVRALDGADCD